MAKKILNKSKRIGIILSVIWVLGAGLHTYTSEKDVSSRVVTDIQVHCINNLADKSGAAWDDGFNRCDQEDDKAFAQDLRNARLDAAIVAFGGVPLGWGFIYLILFLIRWVKRG